SATLTYDTLRFGEFEDFPETTEPVWILGREYSALTGLIRNTHTQERKKKRVDDSVCDFSSEKDGILSDVTSRLWFTYRKGFPPIGGTGPTSDTGWGCMLRCGQMILGQALMCRHLGRDWRWVSGEEQRHEYVNILNAFIDKKDSYYSIHQIERLCMPWLDKAEACAASEGVGELNGYLEGACAFSEEETALWKPLVLLIPLRLGLTDINEAYIETLKKCFMLPQSLGVIGGKPNSAHYFIGYVGEELIYLDPHTTQTAVDPCEDGTFTDDSYHCQHPPCRMHICELDPSIAAGFFCRTEDEFDDWCMRIRRLSCNRDNLPMFELVESQPSHMVSVDAINLTPDFSDSERLERFFYSEDEEFEILSF
ncbi:unnamed protein product, partial [Tetraodon nigroviridis]